MKRIIIPIFLALTMSGCMLNGGTAAEGLLSTGAKVTEALTVSDAEIAEYVHATVQKMDSENHILGPGTTYGDRLNRLTKGLTGVNGMPLNFKVYRTDQINAFACADGSVRVFSGIMDIMDDDELLGVIGHEIGHVAHKDTKKAFKQALISSAVRDGLSSVGGVVGDLSQSVLGDLAEAVMSAKYSQSQETKADSYGYDFLVANGKNPWAMASSFKKLKQIEEKSGHGGSAVLQMFSSHPDATKRISAIEKRCVKDGYSKPSGY